MSEHAEIISQSFSFAEFRYRPALIILDYVAEALEASKGLSNVILINNACFKYIECYGGASVFASIIRWMYSERMAMLVTPRVRQAPWSSKI